MSDKMAFRSSCISLDNWHYRFRVLVMHLFMDDLAMEEIEKFFFIYNLPARLKDVPGKLRAEVLNHVRHQGLINEWSKNPCLLQELLKELGRSELAAKVDECLSTMLNKQELLDCDECAQSIATAGSSTSFMSEGLQPRPLSNCRPGGELLAAKRRQRMRCTEKAVTDWLDSERMPCAAYRDNSLKLRESLTTSEATSSGYWSSRSSRARLSQLSVADGEANEIANSETLKEGKLQFFNHDWMPNFDLVSNLGSDRDERDSMSTCNCLSYYHFTNILSSTEVATSVEGTKNGRRQNIDTLSCTPSHMYKDNFTPFCEDHFSQDHGSFHVRSKSLPAILASPKPPGSITSECCTTLCPLQLHSSNSSFTTLDSETTAESASELHDSHSSLASAVSSRSSDQACCSVHKQPTERSSPSAQQLLYPVSTQVSISGHLEIKMKTVLKLINKNSQKPFTSDEFPSLKDYRGLLYKLRFFPLNFGKKGFSLYIDVAERYLYKRHRNKVITIPQMDVTATLYHCKEEADQKHEIAMSCVQTKRREIDCHSKTGEGCTVVACFPQFVSHSELNLSAAEGRGTLLISVNMKYECV